MATAKEIFVEKYAGGFYGDDLSLKARFVALCEIMFDTEVTGIPGDDTVTLGKMAHMATASLLGRATAEAGHPEVLSAAQVRTLLGLVTAISGASTDAQLPSAKLVYDQLALKQPKLAGVEIVTDNRAIVAADNNKIFGCGTAAKAFTLPATIAGFKVTFVNTGAAGNNIVTVTPVAADGISGTFTLAASVVVDAGVVSKSIMNTAATSQAGDSVTLIGTGVTGSTAWIVLSSTGIWAAQG